jgi:outer membrane protein OmpA-like peptidoglycan-associated protein
MQKQLMILVYLVCSFINAAANDTLTIYFPFNQYTLLKEQTSAVTTVINKNKSNIQSIQIIGHSDQLGSSTYNNNLSLKRAKAVFELLKKEGIDTAIISTVEGKGNTELVTTSYRSKDRQLNRRVLIFIAYKTSAPLNEHKEERVKTREPKKETTLAKKIKDSTVKQGDKLILKNINFIGGRHIFLRESYPALQELLEAMQNIPTLEIEIQGHICCQETGLDGLDLDTQTQDLSVRRAKAVYDFLINNGIRSERMIYKGMARQYPITLERNEAERSINRRVEIVIIKK